MTTARRLQPGMRCPIRRHTRSSAGYDQCEECGRTVYLRKDGGVAPHKVPRPRGSRRWMEQYTDTQEIQTVVAAPSPEWWWLFYKDMGDKGVDAFVVRNRNVATMRPKLAEWGYSLLWDSAPSREVALERAADGSLLGDDGNPVYAYGRCCSLCGDYRPTYKVRRGWRWDRTETRKIPFNGYACDACLVDRLNDVEEESNGRD